jgi:hypothetical protein
VQRHRGSADGVTYGAENAAVPIVRRQVHCWMRILQRHGHRVQNEAVLSVPVTAHDVALSAFDCVDRS